MKRFINALLLRGLWKLKPIHVAVLWLLLIHQAWLASPYIMYHVVGAPEPGTAQRYVGKLRVEGEVRRSRSGWTSPEYFLDTATGSVEFHCGYRPIRQECIQWFGPHLGYGTSMFAGRQFEIGYDPFWGVDYIRYPDIFKERQPRDMASSIEFWRAADLEKHRNSALALLAACLVYAYLIWQASQRASEGEQP